MLQVVGRTAPGLRYFNVEKMDKASTSGPCDTHEVTAHPQMHQLDGLTSLRFIAAIFVVAYHFSYLHFRDAPKEGLVSLGYTGVSFFFILSGFILSYNYRGVDFSDRRNWQRFFLARVARIYPVYLASLVMALPFFCATLIKIQSEPLKALFGSSAILAPLGLQAWVPGAACALNCPSWSLSAEFFFYLLFPLVFPMICARPKPWMWLTSVAWCATLAIVWFAWTRLGNGLSIVGDLGADPAADIAAQFLKYFPLLRVCEFLFGIFLFLFWEKRGFSLPTSALACAFILCWLFLALIKVTVPESAYHDGLTALAWAPLILLGANVTRGPLVWPAMLFLGRISFALYLTHASVLALVLWLDKHLLGGIVQSGSPWLLSIPGAIAAIAVAALFYTMIENPARHYIMGRRRASTSSDLAGTRTY
jgi:peptidoglycan/LPS O-acetylase OafA/YrhL